MEKGLGLGCDIVDYVREALPAIDMWTPSKKSSEKAKGNHEKKPLHIMVISCTKPLNGNTGLHMRGIHGTDILLL